MEGSAGTTGRAPVELAAVGPNLFGFAVLASFSHPLFVSYILTFLTFR